MKLFCEQQSSQSKGTRVSTGAPQTEDSNTTLNHISVSWVNSLTVCWLIKHGVSQFKFFRGMTVYVTEVFKRQVEVKYQKKHIEIHHSEGMELITFQRRMILKMYHPHRHFTQSHL